MSGMNFGKVQSQKRIKRCGLEPIVKIPLMPIKPPKKKKTKAAKEVRAPTDNPVVALKVKTPKPPRVRLSAEALQEKRLADAAATSKKVVVERKSLPARAHQKPSQAEPEHKKTGQKAKKKKAPSRKALPKPKNRPPSIPPLVLKNPNEENTARTKRKIIGNPSNPSTQPNQTFAATKKIDYAKFVEYLLPRIPQMALDELRAIWANCIRAVSGDKKVDAAVFRLMEAIESLWDRSLDLETYDQQFKWPDTWAVAGKNKGFEFDQPDGMFSYLEYRVGRTNGQHAPIRRIILIRMFEGKLPRVFDKQYMNAWGEPKTAKRLRKMAESLASFTRNLKRHENEKFNEAIRDWEADLKFLHDHYYVPLFSFGWPATSL